MKTVKYHTHTFNTQDIYHSQAIVQHKGTVESSPTVLEIVNISICHPTRTQHCNNLAFRRCFKWSLLWSAVATWNYAFLVKNLLMGHLININISALTNWWLFWRQWKNIYMRRCFSQQILPLFCYYYCFKYQFCSHSCWSRQNTITSIKKIHKMKK